MKLLDKYVAKNFIIGYIISLLVLVGLRVVIDMFVKLDEFAEHAQGGGGTVAVLKGIFNYYSIQCTLYFRDFAGIITVVAAVFSLGKMTRNNELIAVMASGVSLKRVIAPIVFLAVIFSFFLVIDQEFIIPRFANRLVKAHDAMASDDSYDIWFMNDNRSNLICSMEYDEGTETMLYPTILIRKPDENNPDVSKVNGIVKADMAFYDSQKDTWELMNVVFSYIDRSQTASNIIAELSEFEGFEISTDIIIKKVTPDSKTQIAGLQEGDKIIAVNNRDVSDCNQVRTLIEQSGPEKQISLFAERNGRQFIAAGDLRNLNLIDYYYKSDVNPQTIPMRQQEGYKALLSSKQLSTLAGRGARIKDQAELYSQKHFRITEPIINMVMLMVALPILVSRDPKAMKSAIMISFAITLLCFIVTFVCKLVAAEAVFGFTIMPETWPWAPVAIFLPIAVLELDSMKT